MYFYATNDCIADEKRRIIIASSEILKYIFIVLSFDYRIITMVQKQTPFTLNFMWYRDNI